MYPMVPKVSLLCSVSENFKKSNGIIYNKAKANADLKIYRYPCLHVKKIYRRFCIIEHLLSGLCAPKIYEMFVYKIQNQLNFSKISLLFVKSSTSRVNKPRILGIKNAKRLGYCFYAKPKT